MPALYATIGILGLAIVYGAYHRAASGAFSYAHFCDKTNYLNHYDFISLVLLLVTLAPVGREGHGFAPRRVPRLWLWLFRFQIACVYLGGGLAQAPAGLATLRPTARHPGSLPTQECPCSARSLPESGSRSR
jgi:vitamin K-dependent gamma-carboxylase